MEWKSIKNTGKVKEFHKAIPSGDGKIKTGQFLNDTLDQFAGFPLPFLTISAIICLHTASVN